MSETPLQTPVCRIDLQHKMLMQAATSRDYRNACLYSSLPSPPALKGGGRGTCLPVRGISSAVILPGQLNRPEVEEDLVAEGKPTS
jgi:hypothetical protein